MRSSETQSGNSTVSFRELGRKVTVPYAAWQQYRKALGEDDRGHYSESFRLATSAATLWPGFPQVHIALALWLMRNDNIEDAFAEIQAALQLDPYYLPAHELLGVAAMLRGDLSEARVILDAAVVSDPTRGFAQCFLSRTLSGLGEFALAADHMKSALRLRDHPARPSVEYTAPFPEPE